MSLCRQRSCRVTAVWLFLWLVLGTFSAFPQGPLALVSLDDAIRLALAHNHALLAQRLNIDQAQANQISASLKPNPVWSMVNEDFPVFSPKDMTFANLRDNQEFLQSVTYLIERGGKRNKRVVVAQDTTDVTVRTVADAERQLRFQVAQAFVAVLLAKSNLELAQDDLKNFTSVVDINQQRLRAGDISEGDYLKISLQKLQFEQDVSGGQLEHRKYVVLLEELRQRALASRADLQAAQSGVRLANDTVALAYGNRARDFTGEVEYKRNGPVNGLGFGASIEIPIHNRNQGEILRSQHAVRQAQEAEAATRAGVLTDVANAFWALRSSDQVVSLFESGYLEQARQSREISNYAYRRGAASLLDLLDAERSYRATRLAYRQALSAYMINAEQVNLAVGAQVLP